MPPPVRAVASATSAAARRAAVGINMPSRAVAAALLAAAPAPVAHKKVLEAVTEDPAYGGLVTSATHFKRVIRAMTDAGRLRVVRQPGNVVQLRTVASSSGGAEGGAVVGIPGEGGGGGGAGGRLGHRPVKPVFKLQLTRKGEVIYRRYLGMDGPEGGGPGAAAPDGGVGLAAAMAPTGGGEGNAGDGHPAAARA
ncbi:hypothetical protein MMPV_007444 [Pyropia vietnamensis]